MQVGDRRGGKLVWASMDAVFALSHTGLCHLLFASIRSILLNVCSSAGRAP